MNEHTHLLLLGILGISHDDLGRFAGFMGANTSKCMSPVRERKYLYIRFNKRCVVMQ